MNELEATATHVYGTLAAASGVTALVSTRIYDGIAPQGVAYPFITFDLPNANDIVYVGGNRGHSDVLLHVTAWNDSHSRARCYDIMDAVDSALDRTISIAGSYHVWKPVRRNVSNGPDELIEGKLVRKVRYTYELVVYDPNDDT